MSVCVFLSICADRISPLVVILTVIWASLPSARVYAITIPPAVGTAVLSLAPTNAYLMTGSGVLALKAASTPFQILLMAPWVWAKLIRQQPTSRMASRAKFFLVRNIETKSNIIVRSFYLLHFYKYRTYYNKANVRQKI